MTDDRPAVYARVNPDTKQKWEDKVIDDPSTPFNSWGSAVKFAMEQTFFTDDDNDAADVDVDLAPVHDRLDDITDQLGEMSDRLDRVDVHTTDMDTTDLVTRLMDLLPMHDKADRLEPLARAASYESPRRRAEQMSTPGAYADYFDLPEDTVRDALNLIEEAGQAEYITDNGRRRYWVPMNITHEQVNGQ